MSLHYVTFIASDEAVIRSEVDGPQDINDHPFQGVVEDDDPRYLSFTAPLIATVITDPVEKLKAFLEANPDVAAILK